MSGRNDAAGAVGGRDVESAGAEWQPSRQTTTGVWPGLFPTAIGSVPSASGALPFSLGSPSMESSAAGMRESIVAAALDLPRSRARISAVIPALFVFLK